VLTPRIRLLSLNMGRCPLALGIGQKTADRRWVLLYFDLTHRKMKVEVGYGLEGYFPDVYVPYLVNE
jgi:uncharacterized membrane protein YgcG